MKHNFNLFFNALFALALVMSVMFGVVTPVAAQNTNVTDWEDKAYVADFAAGKVNAIFEPENPIPAEAPKEVLEALKRGAYLVVNEPYKAGCGDEPVTNVNCNVGFIRSFTDWNDMRDFVYSEKSEGNKGHFGPWTQGSFKISFIREMTADEMEIADWAAYMRGEIRVNFTENKPLPAKDPTNGLVDHALSEPWRHGCNGDSTNPNCQVGSAGVGNWEAVLKYLKDGKWTRGSIVAWPKEASATAVPSNTPAVTNTPAAGSATGTATIPPTATVQPTFTATPGAVGEEVPTDEGQAALPAAETPREGGGGFWLLCCGSLLVIAAILIWANWRKIRRWMDRNGIYPYDETPAAEQPAEEGDLGNGDGSGNEGDALLAPAEEQPEQPSVEEPILRRRRHQG